MNIRITGFGTASQLKVKPETQETSLGSLPSAKNWARPPPPSSPSQQAPLRTNTRDTPAPGSSLNKWMKLEHSNIRNRPDHTQPETSSNSPIQRNVSLSHIPRTAPENSLNKWKKLEYSDVSNRPDYSQPDTSNSPMQRNPSSLHIPRTAPESSFNKWRKLEHSDISGRPDHSEPETSSSPIQRNLSSSSISCTNTSYSIPEPRSRDDAILPSSPSQHSLPRQPINRNIQTNKPVQGQHRTNNPPTFQNRQDSVGHNQYKTNAPRSAFERPLDNARRQQTPSTTIKPLIKKLKPKPKGSRSAVRRKNVYIPTTLTVATLSKLLKVKLDYLLSKMRQVGMGQEATYDYILTSDYAVLLADELGFNPIVDDEAAFDLYASPPHPDPSSLPLRPPVVTIMGHVDHGKTTLLDTLRSASVAKGEAGGITQHIGAFSVPVSSQNSDSSSGPQTITFLDTPGHAAFSAMRARGADVTDIVVLVVAADDGIMPQTKEVINLLKREGSHVSLVVAINKVDKPGADTDAVKKALMVEGVQLEDFGGDTPSVHVSGLTGQGLPDLVETLSAVAEMQDLRAERGGPAFGHILESNFHKGLGPVATVLVQRGSLKVGSRIISGLSQGKVRRMTDSTGKVVQIAIPGMAVTVSGWKTLPKAGDEILEASEADIKKALANRIRMAEKEALHEDVEAINSSRKLDRDARAATEMDDQPARDNSPYESESGPKELKLILKADVSGSSEALEGALHNIGNSVAISKVMSTGVGDITESDVMMARVAGATILGFSVSAPRLVQNLAAQNGVQIFTSNIIYRLVEDVRERIISLLPKIIETKVLGEATVLQIFEIQLKSKQMAKVAGCRVTNGNVEKQKFARVVRDGEIIYEGALDTMRHLKKDITEARKGMECGLSLKDFSDLQEGDMIQMYEKIEKPGIL
ncbi:hypothetical protein CVT25_011327 [Psilocybe cyanescens]|uniref:Translation initiation factor IF-2, mitochondrial n=1 Tax=Psilocybe cyanescens TaxID=93625 RepID=A0A409WGF7_PSICY|nr:hypothetical protein CVT25_011327 [Psilocybe cyanescens]